VADLADFPTLLRHSTVSYQTFCGDSRVVDHPAVADRAMRALRDAMERAREPSRVKGTGSSSFSGFFFSGIDEDDAELAEPSEGVLRLWFERPDRFREQLTGGDDMVLLVRDGPRWWSYDPELGTLTNEDEEESLRSTVESGYENLLAPSKLLTRLQFEPLGDGNVAGRRTARVRAYPTPKVNMPDTWQSVGFGVGADEYGLDVDAERGVILRVASKFSGDELELVEAVQVAFDEPLAPDTFTFGSWRA
jgi:outer membrane lipoprotein-sorting protein